MPRTDPHHACDDFHRTSDAVRNAHLRTALTRRQILGWGLGGAVSLYMAKAMSVTRMLEAATADAAAAPNAPILVSVFLPGGTDLLDTLVPLDQYGPYRDARGALAQAGAGLPALSGTGLGLHPSLALGSGGGVKGLWEQGKIGFLPGIDYANPNLSHFHSRHFWETGLITEKAAPGWLGRWLDRAGNQDNPFQGVSAGSRLSPVMTTAGAPAAAIESPSAVELSMRGLSNEEFFRALATYDVLAKRTPDAPGPASVMKAARLSKQVADRLRGLRRVGTSDPLAPAVPYPPENPFGNRLRGLAALLSLPFGVRVATVDADGDFDTHDNQAANLTSGLADVSTALAAFQSDLEARGLGDRVITLVWTEFGRRVKGNRSSGTDHGAGGVGWIQGVHARTGLLTPYPSLTDLDKQKNLKVTVDFRTVYASLLEQWLATDAAAIIPNAGAFGRLALVK